MQVPADTPVTCPQWAQTEATASLELDHMPPVIVSANTMVPPVPTIEEPVIIDPLVVTEATVVT